MLFIFGAGGVSAKTIKHKAVVKKSHHAAVRKVVKGHGSIFPWTFAVPYDQAGTIISLAPLTFTGSASTTFTVDTTNSKILSRYSAPLQFSDLQIGDQIEVSGKATGTSIPATLVRDVASKVRIGLFEGTVVSKNGESFVLKNPSYTVQAEETVTTDSSTLFVKSNQSPASFADLAVGAHVTVTGVSDRTGTTIGATAISIAASR